MKSTIKKSSKNNLEMVEIKEKKRDKKVIVESSDDEPINDIESDSDSDESIIEKPKRKVNYVLTEARKNNIIKMQKARAEKIEQRKIEKQKLDELKRKELELKAAKYDKKVNKLSKKVKELESESDSETEKIIKKKPKKKIKKYVSESETEEESDDEIEVKKKGKHKNVIIINNGNDKQPPIENKRKIPNIVFV